MKMQKWLPSVILALLVPPVISGGPADLDWGWPGSAWAVAHLQTEKIRVAESRKTQSYIADGLFVGGDRAIDDITVKDIRRASNSGFERLVIDIDGNENGNPTLIQRPPYYHVAVSPDEKRIVFTVWGKPKLAFDAKKVISQFKKSPVISGIELYPRLEEDSWTFTIALNSDRSVEVFELANPVRIIVDIRGEKKAVERTGH